MSDYRFENISDFLHSGAFSMSEWPRNTAPRSQESEENDRSEFSGMYS